MLNFLPEVKAPYSLYSVRNVILALFLFGGIEMMAQSTTISVIPAGPYCSGESFSITFTKTGTFNAGNTFTAQLSDATGAFGSPISLGTLSGTAAGSISVTLPTNVAAGTGYKMRVNGSNPQGGTQTANATSAFSIREAYTPTNYLTETVGTVASGSIATHESNSRFSATAQTYSGSAAISSTSPSSGYTGATGGNNVFFTNSGENLVIQGLVTTGFERTTLSFGLYKGTNNQNGSNFVVEYTTTGNWSGAVALTFPSLSNGTGWYPILINEYLPAASSLWLRFSTTNSQDFRLDDIIVNKATAATVSISPSTTQSICSGASVNFTATSLTGATYAWSDGATTAANSVSPSTNTNYSVTVTDYLGCTPNRGPITVNVTANVTPSVSVSASSTTICSGASVTFTATPTNGGTPSYQWKVNGVNAGTNSATFTSTTLANSDVVTVVMTSSLSCVTSATATSTGITMTVNPNLTPSISISPSANPICAGTSVTFTATPTNGGASPSYQWKLGASNVGTNSATYTNASLANGNSITCVITSNATCLATPTATSSAVVMTVNPVLTPSVSISASATTICSGTSVTFTATPTNGGASPSYQWKIGATNVGTNSPTFTSTTLANTNSVTCVMTSNATCVSPATATSSAIVMTVNANVTPSVSVSASSTAICAGASVTFTATPTNGGTTPAYQWQVNGVNAGTNSATFTSTTLANNDVVTVIMTSNATCPSPATATSTGITMTVNPNLTPSISISPSANPICAGTSVTFTATPTNGGTTPSYQWKLGASNVGTNSATYTNASLANGNSITCVITSNATCLATPTATSSAVVMTVNANVTPSVSVSSTATTICAGTNVTFTATPTNGGTTPSYQWKVNGVNAGANSATYASSTLANNDVVTVVMTSNATCPSPATATSTGITMTVNPNLTPAISISPSANPICAGTSVTFTATPTNGGAAPSYQWKLGATSVGTNSPTYTNASLANGNSITCVLTSNATCLATTTATSSATVMTVNPLVTPSVSISASATTICAGTNVTFTATPTNGGTTPNYQWYRNGITVGTNSATYSNAVLTNGDIISVTMVSTATCPSPTSVSSSNITMTVNPILTPSVSIAASSSTICAGASVTFTATPTNGGTTPSYQWKKNGVNTGTNSATLTSTTFANGDAITCVLTSNATCAAPTTATSNSVTMTVNPYLTPSVSVSASATTICAGTSVTFTATPTNGGASPSYQWKVNGSNVGTNSATYTSTTLANNNVVTVVMTSNYSCLNTPTATSTGITMTVNPILTPTITISASPSAAICIGSNATFSATITNGGSSPSYQWSVNGSSVGTNSTYSSTAFADGDVVTCRLTSNYSCPSTNPVTSSGVAMTIYDLPIIATTPVWPLACSGGTGVSVTASGASTYAWSPATGLSASTGASVTANPSTGTTYTVTGTDSNGCVSTDNVFVGVSSGNASTSISASGSTTFCNGSSVTLTATSNVSNGTVTIGTNTSSSNAADFGSALGPNPLQNFFGGSKTQMLWRASELSAQNIVAGTIISSIAFNMLNGNPSYNLPNLSVAIKPTTTTSLTSFATNMFLVRNPASFAANDGWSTINFDTPFVYDGTSNLIVEVCYSTGGFGTISNNNRAYYSSTSFTSTLFYRDINTTAAEFRNYTGSEDFSYSSRPQIRFATSTTYSYAWSPLTAITPSNSLGSAVTVAPTGSTTYTVTATSSANCAATASQTITVNPNLTPSVAISSNQGTTICASTPVTFTATPTNGGTTPSYAWKKNGVAVGSNSATYSNSLLANNDVISVTMTSNAACLATSTATNSLTMTVNPYLTPSVSIAASANNQCAGSSITFTATPTNGGTSPTYAWRKNGVANGSTGATFTTSSLVTGDVISVIMTSNYACLNTPTATSNNVTMTFVAYVTPSVSLASSPSIVCPGTTVTFTATPTNGGVSPTYVWKKNGTVVGGSTATYSDNTLVNGDLVDVTLTTSAQCYNSLTANASTTVTVNPTLTPSVSLATSPSTTICAGTAVTFTATPTNGGTTPNYAWKKNGVTVGTNSPTYSNSSLADTDVISVVMTSNANCLSTATGTASQTMTVNPFLTPSVSIVASANNQCAGSSITFTATPTNGGTAPTYAWRKNGVANGSTGSTFTASSLVTGDVISVIMTSNYSCLSTPTATSNSVTTTFVAYVTPSVSLASSPSIVCPGATVTFTATPTNGGATPTYVWKKNGSIVGGSSSTYSDNTLVNGDVVDVTLTTSAQCYNTLTANASTSVTVNPTLTPSVSLATSPSTTICAGTAVTFTATPTNGGTTPSYSWKKNGVTVGTNSPTYSNSSLADTDVISVVMTSNANCLSTATGTASQTMTVNPFLAPSVSIAASSNPVCAGGSVTFTATPTNGGATPSYDWKKNGVSTGNTGATFTSSSLANNDVITVVMTTSYACPTVPTATSNGITMTVTAYVTPSVTLAVAPAILCPGTSATLTATPSNGGATPTYEWRKNGSIVGGSGATYTDATLVDGDVIDVILTTSVMCYNSLTANASTTVTVNPFVTPSVSVIPSTGSAICAGDFVSFSANITDGGAVPTYAWKRNGSTVSTASTYSSGSISNGTDISVTITSNAACATPTTASDNVLMTVTQPVAPFVTVASSSNTICAGQPMTFTATPGNGGSTPSYQWKKNGNNVGSDQDTYTDNSLVNGDQITVVMLSSATCAQPASATGNTVTMTVNPNLTPSIALSANPICDGSNLIVTTAINNEGTTPTFDWFHNGNAVGSSTSGLSLSGVANGDIIVCVLTSSEACVTSSTANSNSLSAIVNINPSISITGADNICSLGTNPTTVLSTQIDAIESGATLSTYQWLRSGNTLSGANGASYTASQTGSYSLLVEDSNGCSGISSPFVVDNSTYTITVIQGANGTAAMSGSSSAICGTTRVITMTPNDCYQIIDVLVDGVSQGTISTVNLSNISADHTVEAIFGPIMYQINADYASLGTGGIISPSGNLSFACGTTQTFAIIPDPCYHVVDVIVNGFSQGPISSYTIANVSSNSDIYVVFAVDQYTVNVIQPTGGNITPGGLSTFNCGTTQTFNIDALPGYVVNGIDVDGQPVGALTSYTMNNISANHTIQAYLSTSPINNNRNNAPSVIAFNLPSCYNTQGTLAGCTASNESSYHAAPAGAGQDAWYRFTVPAGSTGIARILVSNTNNDVAIILQRDLATAPFYQPIAVEDALHAPGGEMMTAQGLIPGVTYRIAVQNMGLQTAGSFSLCVTYVKSVTCLGGNSNAKNLCESFVGGYTGANQYVFTFTNTANPSEVFNRTLTGVNGYPSQTAIVLNSLTGLRYGASYNVKIDAAYNFANAAGQFTNVTVPGANPTCVLYTVAQPETELSDEHHCDEAPVRYTTFLHTGFVCGAIDYQWELTPMTGLPFPWTTRRYSSSRYIRVGDLNGVYSGASHFHVRVRPIFADGQGGERFGVWGDTDEMCLLAAAAAPTINDEVGTTYPAFQQRSLSNDVQEVDIELYPNPTNGEAITLNMDGIQDDTIQMKVTDALGRTIWSNQYSVDGTLRTSIALGNNISNGLYLLEINYDGKVATRRIMIQR